MAIQWVIIRDILNPVQDTRNVLYLMHDTSTSEITFDLKTMERVIGRLEDATLQVPQLMWDELGVEVAGTPTSRRVMWGAYMQKSDDPIRGAVIAAVYALVLAGSTANQMNLQATALLEQSDFQALILNNTKTAFQNASENEFRETMAIAIAIILGRLGQASET
jgi:hypothetical protein